MTTRLLALTELARIDNPVKILESEFTWPQFVEQLRNHKYKNPGFRSSSEGKRDLPAYSPVRFKSNTKHATAANVEKLSVLILDFDKDPDLDMLKQCWAGYSYFAHTSINHKPEFGKWRIMLPLKRDVVGKDYAATWHWAEERCQAYGLLLDTSTKNPDRKWLHPYRDGEFYAEISNIGSGDWVCPDTCRTQASSKPQYTGAFVIREVADTPILHAAAGPIDILSWMRGNPLGAKVRGFCPMLSPEEFNSEGACMFRTARGVTIKCGAHHHEKHKGHDLYMRVDDPNVGGANRPPHDKEVWRILEKKVDKEGNAGAPLPSKYNLLTILESDTYLQKELWFDSFSQRPIYRNKPMDDATSFRVLVWIERAYQTSFPKAMFTDALRTALNERQRNPLQEWAGELSWDGVSRIDNFASVVFGDESELANKLMKMWLVSAAARMMRPGCKADHAIILAGPQGIGKSTVLRYLASDEYFSDTMLNMDTRQAFIQVQGSWIHELGEMASLKRSEVETAKQFIAAKDDKYVAPYGKELTVTPRRCVFAGTTNEFEFLVDDTGNRRFWTIVCKYVDTGYVLDNREQIWAEAITLYLEGFQYWPDKDDSEKLTESQEEFRERRPWEDAVNRWVIAQAPSLRVFSMSDAIEQIMNLELRHQDKFLHISVGKFLRKLGCKKIQVKPPKSRVPLVYYCAPNITEEQGKELVKKLFGVNKNHEEQLTQINNQLD
jgi:predicted P-loop ATPase